MPSIAIPVSLRGQLLSGSGFSPASIFSNNEPGIWLDPSDLTTMFQDRAGSTAVTTPGQSVGLRLDKSKGLVLGSELVTNGDFSDGTTGWTVGPDWTISGGFASRGSNATASNLIGGSGVEAGKYYRVTWTQGNEFVAVYLGSLAGPLVLTTNVAGTYTRIVLATTAGGIAFRSSGAVSLIDNVSVKELPGNHAVANSDAARGIYGIEPVGGRRNLLTFTEQFDNAVWVKNVATVTANQSIAPDGTTTADLVAGGGFVRQPYTIPASAIRYTYSVYAKANADTAFAITEAGATASSASFTLSGVGSVSVIDQGGSPSATIVSAGNGWYRCTFSYTTNGVQTTLFLNNTAASAFLWGAQLETGSTATAYQRVTTQYDVTEAGKQTLHYVQYDGSDDGYVTPTITPGIDKVQVFAGVRKLSDAASGILAEFSADWGSNAGSWFIHAPESNGVGTYSSGARGSAALNLSQRVLLSQNAPDTAILTTTHDISGDLSILRRNGVSGTNATGDKGTGNFLAYPLYIGRRGGTTLPFNGRDYGIITRFGANLDASTIAATESWLNQKTGAY